MSYSASTIGFPVLRDSRSASAAVFCRIFSASLNNTRPRSCAVVFDHGPSSNAFRAAFTATSTSVLSAALTRAITSSVDGSYTGKVSPDALAAHCPFTKFRYVFTSAFTLLDMTPSESHLLLRLLRERCGADFILSLLHPPAFAPPSASHTQKRKTPRVQQTAACHQTSIPRTTEQK